MINLSETRRRKWWRFTVVMAVIIVLITYSPVVLVPGKTEPRFLHMPYSLWVTMVFAILLVFLTWLGGKLYGNGIQSGKEN